MFEEGARAAGSGEGPDRWGGNCSFLRCFVPGFGHFDLWIERVPNPPGGRAKNELHLIIEGAYAHGIRSLGLHLGLSRFLDRTKTTYAFVHGSKPIVWRRSWASSLL